jgi:Protein of unknown function (DUF2934)
MQSSKTSKKTSKIVDKTTVAAEENTPAAEPVAKPRVSRSSKTKKEVSEMASGTHRHKSSYSSTSIASASEEVKPLNEMPSHAVHPRQIAELAYSYWVERGYAHGAAEEDWLRAERVLTGR